jgi:zinc transport system substrate-binding protein
MVRRFMAVGVLGALVLVVAACGGDDASPSDTSAAGGPTSTGPNADPLRVVANFYPLAEALQRVGGDRVDVINLTPPGSEPHDIEVTSDDVDAIEDADLVVYLGGGFQPAVEHVAEDRSGPTLDIATKVALEAGDHEAIEAEEGDEHAAEDEHAEEGDDHGEVDPHFWLDPTLMQAAVDAIQAELATLSPTDEATFAANAAAYDTELAALDAEFAAGLTGCARAQIVTAHAAFYYLAHRYGLEQLAITGLSPESEPDPQRLDELADLVEREGVTTIFSETLVSPEIAETLARETGVTTAVLNPLEGLTDDQLDDGETYLSVQRENLAALQTALDCPAS